MVQFTAKQSVGNFEKLPATIHGWKRGVLYVKDIDFSITYEWNKRRTLPNKEVKVGAEFMPQYTTILRKYSFGMRLRESQLESMLEAAGFYNTQYLNLEIVSQYQNNTFEKILYACSCSQEKKMTLDYYLLLQE